MKTAGIFVVIVVLAFIGIFMLFKQNTAQTANPNANFLTPTDAKPQTFLSTTPIPTVPEADRVSASRATIKTELGNIDLELYATAAAKTVMNFSTLAHRGYYNNLTFHRVESWVVQGGDPNGNGSGGVSIYGPVFEDEIDPNNDLYKTGYVRGTLAMANRGPNTNGSQFFIIKNDTPLQPNYTIFGKVTNGMDVVDQITPGTKILGIDIE